MSSVEHKDSMIELDSKLQLMSELWHLQIGSRIGKLGNRVLTSSKDLFEQVAEAVQIELDSIEGHVRRPKAGKQSLAKRCPACFSFGASRVWPKAAL